MDKKIGRNDPCPCGSGKKYKQCCLAKPGGRLKFKAKVISQKETKQAPDLLERTFGEAISSAREENVPPKPEQSSEES